MLRILILTLRSSDNLSQKNRVLEGARIYFIQAKSEHNLPHKKFQPTPKKFNPF